ncbi:MAG: hypothetical protein KGJ60_13990 [Verrucomicrobiota bacterium]|nr:hypothetical protein [Verrucomicrobiota bacterium]
MKKTPLMRLSAAAIALASAHAHLVKGRRAGNEGEAASWAQSCAALKNGRDTALRCPRPRCGERNEFPRKQKYFDGVVAPLKAPRVVPAQEQRVEAPPVHEPA